MYDGGDGAMFLSYCTYHGISEGVGEGNAWGDSGGEGVSNGNIRERCVL